MSRDFGLANPETVLSESVRPQATVDDLARGCVHAREELWGAEITSLAAQPLRLELTAQRNLEKSEDMRVKRLKEPRHPSGQEHWPDPSAAHCIEHAPGQVYADCVEKENRLVHPLGNPRVLAQGRA